MRRRVCRYLGELTVNAEGQLLDAKMDLASSITQPQLGVYVDGSQGVYIQQGGLIVRCFDSTAAQAANAPPTSSPTRPPSATSPTFPQLSCIAASESQSLCESFSAQTAQCCVWVPGQQFVPSRCDPCSSSSGLAPRRLQSTELRTAIGSAVTGDRRLLQAGRKGAETRDNCSFSYVGSSLLDVGFDTLGVRTSTTISDKAGSTADDGSNLPGLYLRLEEVDYVKTKLKLNAPRLPVSQVSVQQLLEYGVDKSLAGINRFLELNPIILPQTFLPYAPNPTLFAIPQGSPANAHGYFDLGQPVCPYLIFLFVRACPRCSQHSFFFGLDIFFLVLIVARFLLPVPRLEPWQLRQHLSVSPRLLGTRHLQALPGGIV